MQTGLCVKHGPPDKFPQYIRYITMLFGKLPSGDALQLQN